MNLIANWQPNGNCRPWYWEKIAYKATLERAGFKFIHPFRHWGEHRNRRIVCLACLAQTNDTWVHSLKARAGWSKVVSLWSKPSAIRLCILVNILKIAAFPAHSIPSEIIPVYYCIICFMFISMHMRNCTLKRLNTRG